MPPHPLDDATIPDSAELLRRIHPNWWVPDKRTGERRLSTAAFDNSTNGTGTSVVISADSSAEAVLQGYTGYGLASPAALPRQHGQGVRRVPDDRVPGHAQIEGEKPRSVKQALVGGCAILVRPLIK